jgi:hypothetical protein
MPDINLMIPTENGFEPRTQALVDSIGRLKAQIAPVLGTLKTLEAALKEYGEGRYLGQQYEATVSVHDRSTLDMAAVREKLTPQFITAHTSTSEVTVLKVTARKVEA